MNNSSRNTPKKKAILSGNEAIARGAYEAGARAGTGYPGTPSTEILQALKEYPGIYTEWSVNEKVALEVAIGASLAGARTLVTMKHVGLNVAADPLFTLPYIGVKGGLVIACADDPGMHSSQNEQDNRNYAYAAKLPCLEPSDSQEAKDFTALAFALSERYNTPVLLRTTTRVSHSQGQVTLGKRLSLPRKKGFERHPASYVMIPAYARPRHVEVERRLVRVAKDAETLSINRAEYGSREVGFITSGACYTYIKEVFPEASVLKLGMVYPLPEKLIRAFCGRVKRAVVVEELDPFIEMRIKALGIAVEGKKYFPLTGELDPDTIREAFLGKKRKALPKSMPLPPRPPALCPGCPHRTVFQTLKKLGAVVSGDIGCYTLGVLPPFNAMDTCVDMGASITIAQGIEIGEGAAYRHNTVAVIGDSTFAHSGITGLINAAYNKRTSLIVVLDNGTTAMTGMQPNPLSGQTITGEQTVALDYGKLAEAVGIAKEQFKIIDAYAPNDMESTLAGFLASGKLSLVVVRGLCIILKKKLAKKEKGGGRHA